MTTARDCHLWIEGPNALPPGPLNAITDVPGVRVGHRTLTGAGLATGVTAILPHGGDLFRQKVRAAVEAELRDLGAAWRTRSKPAHATDD